MSMEPKGNTMSKNQNRQKRKERILICLTRLGDKDTLKKAMEELDEIINELDIEGFALIMSAICHSNKEHKNYVKKESLRLLCALSNSTCPLSNNFFSMSNLPKVLKTLKSSFQDPDGGVRETAAEVYGMITNNWVRCNAALIPGNQNHLVVRTILEGLSDPKKDCQITSSIALSRIAELIEPLAVELIKEIFKIFKNPNFQAKAAFIPAIAGWDHDTDKPVGLIKSNVSTFIPHLNHLIGYSQSSQAAGSGLLNFLISSEWMLRRNAVEALKALAIVVGPSLNAEKHNIISRVQKSLLQAKFDKVKPVREAIQETLFIYDLLSEFIESKEASADWLSWYNNRMPKSDTAGSIGYIEKKDANNRPSLSGCQGNEENKICIKYLKMNPIFETLKEKARIYNSSKGPEGDAEGIKEIDFNRDNSNNSGDQIVRQSFQDIKPLLKTKMQDINSTSDIIIVAPVPPSPACTMHSQTISDDQISMISDILNTPKKSSHKVCVSSDEWYSMVERIETFERQQNRLFEMIEHLDYKINSTAHSFKGDIVELQENFCRVQETANKCWDTRLVHNETLEALKFLAPRPATSASQRDYQSACLAPTDLNAAYTEALSLPTNDLQITRLLQRTGPVIHDLSMMTLNDLLLKFCEYLRDKRCVTRILPWLWQLADSDHIHHAHSVQKDIRNILINTVNDLTETMKEDATRVQVQSLYHCLEEVWERKEKSSDSEDSARQKPIKKQKQVFTKMGKSLNGVYESHSWLQASTEG